MIQFLKIAVRSALQNRKRSLLIALSLFFSCTLLLVSNSIANGAGRQYLKRFRFVQAGDVAVLWHNVEEVDVNDGGRILFSEFEVDEDERNKLALARLDRYLAEHDQQIAAVYKPIRSFGMMDTGRHLAYSMIYGVSEQELAFLEETGAFEVVAGDSVWDYADYTVCISEETAEEYGLSVGDWVVLDGMTQAGLVNSMEFAVAGIYRNGAPWDNLFVYVTKPNARDLLEWDDEYMSSARVFLQDPRQRERFAADLDTVLRADRGTLRAEPAEKTAQVFASMASLQRNLFLFFVIFMLFVIAIGIRATIRMNLFERMTEFGTLRAIGFSRLQNTILIVMEMLMIATLSLLAAIALSLVFVAFTGQAGILIGPGAVSYFLGGERVYPELLPGDVAAALLVIAAFAVFATLRPALSLMGNDITDLLAGARGRRRPLGRKGGWRRGRTLAAALVASLFLASCGMGVPNAPAPVPTAAREGAGASTQEASAPKKAFFRGDEWHEVNITGDWTMDVNIIRVLSAVWHKMGDIGEVLDTASRIRPTSELSWYREWYKTAERVRGIGDDSLRGGHEVSAGEAYLRASNYYRTAEFFMHADPEDPRILESYRKCAELFMKGATLVGIPVEEIRIPYEETTIRGHLYRSPVAAEPGPILLVNQGYDGAIEETKYVAEGAIARGYHCIIYEGPGQGMSVREQGLTFRPDWNVVVGAVVDYVEKLPEVDTDRIGLLGLSFGGGLVVPAAAYEERLAVVIANPGYISIGDVFFDVLRDMDESILNLLDEDPEAFNDKYEAFSGFTEFGVSGRWGFNEGMWKFGADSPADFLKRMRDFNYESIIPEIETPMLIMDGTDEVAGAGQAKALYDALQAPKTYMLFEDESAASLHCQNGNLSVGVQRMFDWLDGNL